MLSTFFSQNPTVQKWKIEFTTFGATKSGFASSSSSIIIYVNQLPTSGTCTVDLQHGYSISTNFNISCSDWMDLDGSIKRYEFFGKNLYFIYFFKEFYREKIINVDIFSSIKNLN